MDRRHRGIIFYRLILPGFTLVNLRLGIFTLTELKPNGPLGWMMLGTGAFCCGVAGWLAGGGWSQGDLGSALVVPEAGGGRCLAPDVPRIGVATMWGGCSEAELALPYLPFLEAIGNHLAQADLDGLRRQLGAAHRELAWLFPQLGLEEPPRDPSDPVQGKLRLYEAVLALLRT